MNNEWEIGAAGVGNIPTTGERFLPWMEDAKIAFEHLHRYLFACQVADGKRVLDLATGEGYGAALLGRVAASVVGLDIDESAISHAELTHAAPTVSFRQGDCLTLESEFPRGRFDVVICFELIEHIADHTRLLAGARHALALDGVLLLSTPNRPVHRTRSPGPNPFHVAELDLAEAVTAVSAVFRHVRVWGQSAISGSEIVAVDDSTADTRSTRFELERRPGGWRSASAPPEYAIILASDTELPVIVERSFLVDRGH